jgi:hypothetical protein
MGSSAVKLSQKNYVKEGDWVAIGHTEANRDRMVIRYGRVTGVEKVGDPLRHPQGGSGTVRQAWQGEWVATILLAGKQQNHTVKRVASPLYLVIVSEETAKKAIQADKRR